MPRFSLSEESDDDDDDVESEEEIEPDHPIGFGSSSSPWGKTWFSLDPPSQSSYISGRTKYGLDDDDDDDENKIFVQSYPPLSSYIRSDQVSTTALLQLDRESNRQQQEQRNLLREHDDDDLYYSGDDEDGDDENSDVALLFLRQQQSSPMTPRLTSAMQKALSVASTPPSLQQNRRTIEHDIQRRVELERQRIDDECRRNNEILGELVLQSKREADVILKKRQAEDERIRMEQKVKDERERKIREEAEKSAKILKAKEDQEASDKQQVVQKQQESNALEVAEKERRQQEKQAKAKRAVEHIDKAKKMVGQLEQVRASVEPFEKNKAVGKRRLGMKKIAKGKVNTLNDNPQKIREVATEISQAVSRYEQEDEQIKQQVQQGNPGFTKDMAIGRRYFVDLLASTVMTRVQAESFGKSDGFPLAAMVSMVSVESKQLVSILAAHIYTVCPTAIPTLPAPKADASEDELMIGLGMQKNKKTGEFESFPQFLARTENIISFMASIQSSLPSSHQLMGGNQGAIMWLKRFIDLLPPAPTSPLPLITAPVLGAFLMGAGHMLAKNHADNFKKLLSIIQNDIVNRIDEGELGKPSAIRLSKVIEGGFDHFLKNLPPKAIPDCYYGASEDSQKNENVTSFAGTIGGEEDVRPKRQQQQQQQGNGGQNNNPFGGASTGGQNGFAQSNNTQSPFCQTDPSSGNSNSNPFGGAQAAAAPQSQSPFAMASAPSGGFANSSPFGGSATPAPTGAFGAPSAAQSQSPFGTASAPSGGFGGGQAQAPAAPSSSTFGAFSTSNANNNSNPSPFGGGSAPSTSAFGGNAAPSPSQFGSGNASSAPSPFGGGNASSSPSPFGGGGNAAPSPSPFGGGGNAAPSPSPFGGGGNAAPSPSPFGGGFGGSQNNTSFNGGGGHNGGGGGNAARKIPCKFFAQGRCRFGDNCKNSHESGGNQNQGYQSNNNQGFQSNNNSNSFGRHRR
jgi:hypothetical protein